MELAKQKYDSKKIQLLGFAAMALLWTSPPSFASTPVCHSSITDSDGDGWGWENNTSCVVPFAANSAGLPGCVTAGSDADGDGYGWENSQSCVVTMLTPAAVSVQPPSCEHPDSDPDGDGWGWENSRSCLVQNTSATHPVCQFSDSDPDNDGWGWENNRSCIVNDTTGDGVPDVGAGLPESDHPVCEYSESDPDNDGWGWENDASCIVQNNQDSDIPDIGAALPGNDHPVCLQSDSDPDDDGWGWENGESCIVADNGNGSLPEEPDEPSVTPPLTDSGHPVCLSTASDPLNTGYGYEFGQSCRVVAGISKTADDPLFNTELCYNWAEIAFGDYRIQNNTWNDSAVYTDQWSQCIELTQNANGDPVATWNFDWLDRSEGDQAQVKSYPQVYYGRKNERNLTGTPEQTGLPRPIDELDSYIVDYAFSTTGEAEYNVALESFFHSSCEAGDDNKQFEMMVWVGVPGEKTPGTLITTATIDGVVWKVYANPVLTWGYVAFVAEQTTPSGQLDWNAFIDWSRENSSGLGLGSMENTCMGAIEMGTETFWGELEFTLEQFEVTRN